MSATLAGTEGILDPRRQHADRHLALDGRTDQGQEGLALRYHGRSQVGRSAWQLARSSGRQVQDLRSGGSWGSLEGPSSDRRRWAEDFAKRSFATTSVKVGCCTASWTTVGLFARGRRASTPAGGPSEAGPELHHTCLADFATRPPAGAFLRGRCGLRHRGPALLLSGRPEVNHLGPRLLSTCGSWI